MALSRRSTFRPSVRDVGALFFLRAVVLRRIGVHPRTMHPPERTSLARRLGPTESTSLARRLGPTAGTAIVVGSVLGTGVFLKSSTMAQTLGSESAVLAASITAGVLSFVGALVYSELGARFLEAGGEYVYLRNGLGDLPAFLFGWTRFWIISPASIAAYAVGSATFLAGSWLPVDPGFATPSRWDSSGGSPR